MNKFNLIFYINFSFFQYIIFIMHIYIIINTECIKEYPISLPDGSCALTYCTNEQFISGECTISNNEIKTQWITNIIWIGRETYRYVNIANYSNGDLIISTTAFPGDSERMFYGLKNNGEYLFENNGKLTPQKIMNVNPQSGNENNVKHESQTFIVNIENKEYLISISNLYQFCELYDFDNDNIYQIAASSVLGYSMTSSRSSSFNLQIGTENFTFFNYWGTDGTNYYFRIRRLKFETKDISEGVINSKEYYIKANEKIANSISCFITNSNYIICFTYIGYYSYSIYYISVYNTDLEILKSETFKKNIYYENYFCKCIYLQENAGIFLYYDKNSNKNKIFPYIIIKFYDSNNNKISDYYSSSIEINFNNKIFNYNSLLNDFIKISNYKSCFTTVS